MITLWGLLGKSAIDNETIEEAVNRLILAHNNDETAHLATGQSLELHKASDVIDHLAGSVVADKATMSEINLYTDFGSLTPWAPFGVYDNSAFPGVVLGSNYPNVNGTRLVSGGTLGDYFVNLAKNSLMEWSIYIADSNYATIFLGVSNVNFPVSGDRAVGFKLVNGQLRGILATSVGFFETAIFSGALNSVNVLRIQYMASSKTFKWYVNGSLLDSYDGSALDEPLNGIFGMYLKESQDFGVLVEISYLKISYQP